MRKIYLSVFILLLFSLNLGAQGANGNVQDMASTLNLRSAPGLSGQVIAELPGNTDLIVMERSANSTWFHVKTLDGAEGWVSANYVKLLVDLSSIPVTETEIVESNVSNAPAQIEGETAARITKNLVGALNFRSQPSLSAQIIGALKPGTGITVLGLDESGAWANIRIANGASGWVSADFIEYVSAESSDIMDNADSSSPSSTGNNSGATITTAGVTAIYKIGRSAGNIPYNFSRVGDSMTASEYFLYPFGHGVYNLGAYGNLQKTIDYFKQGMNSFLHTPLAAGGGWTTAIVLDPKFANSASCQSGESPLECEYRVVRPSVALIMFGSNDIAAMNGDQFAGNLQRITEITISKGIIPVLSTIPPRPGFDVASFNNIIRVVANQYNVPLWDYFSVMASLPNSGLSGDNLHPSDSGGFEHVADFTGDYLKAGYTQRNLGALQVLDSIRRKTLP